MICTYKIQCLFRSSPFTLRISRKKIKKIQSNRKEIPLRGNTYNHHHHHHNHFSSLPKKDSDEREYCQKKKDKLTKKKGKSQPVNKHTKDIW